MDYDTAVKLMSISINPIDVIIDELAWQKAGLQQTQSGYGRKLTTRYKVRHNGKLYRVYAICYSNVSSLYIIADKKTMYIDWV